MPCSQETFEAVWSAFDKARGDIVPVARNELEQFVACHRLNDTPEPADLVEHTPRAHARNIDCNRAALFSMLKSHTCGEPRKLTLRRATGSLN